MKKAIIAVASFLTLAACHANFDKTRSGLVYKIFPGKGGAPVAGAKFVKMDISYTIKKSNGKDTVLNSTYGKFPQYQPIDTGSRVAYTFMEILPKCKVGDSIEFDLSADTIRKRNVNLPLDLFPKGSIIKGRARILNAFVKREDIMADVAKEEEKLKAKEEKGLTDYIAKNHLNAQKTKNGAYVVVETAGEGMKADSGTVALVKYKGYLLDGTVFDGNMDDKANQGYPVKVGEHGVIPGWEEALPYFGKGGKGKIVVPSTLGYGPQGSGPIPPSATLVFDISITDVKPAPPAQQKPMPAAPQAAPAQH